MSLFYLLNIINGIGSQKGQILIITTSYIICLNKALIQPGYIDKKVELGLANNKITANLFCLVFKPIEGNIAFAKNAQAIVS